MNFLGKRDIGVTDTSLPGPPAYFAACATIVALAYPGDYCILWKGQQASPMRDFQLYCREPNILAINMGKNPISHDTLRDLELKHGSLGSH